MEYPGGCRKPVNFPFGAINLMDCKTAHHFLSPSVGWAGQSDWPEKVLSTLSLVLPGSLVKTFSGGQGLGLSFSYLPSGTRKSTQ